MGKIPCTRKKPRAPLLVYRESCEQREALPPTPWERGAHERAVFVKTTARESLPVLKTARARRLARGLSRARFTQRILERNRPGRAVSGTPGWKGACVRRPPPPPQSLAIGPLAGGKKPRLHLYLPSEGGLVLIAPRREEGGRHQPLKVRCGQGDEERTRSGGGQQVSIHTRL